MKNPLFNKKIIQMKPSMSRNKKHKNGSIVANVERNSPVIVCSAVRAELNF